jgi:DNA-binding PadR family transcriptional regulator
MKLLSRAEEIVLLAILKLQQNAYGVALRELIQEETKTAWSFGSIYMPLNKLTRKGYITKSMGEPTPQRGGRSKCLYSVTNSGLEALQSILDIQKNIWADITEVKLKKKA